MAIGYNQIICNARNLATTMNGIINALAEGVTIIGRPKILQLENNDDLLISWYEGTGGGGGGGGGDEPSGGDEVLKALIERSITSVTIPDGTERVGNSAFSNCQNLESVLFPEGVKSLESNAFLNCKKLTSVEIKEGLTLINGYAFGYCTALTTVDLPSTMLNIQANAFYGATGLTSLTVRATTPPYLSSDALKNVPASAAIYVPAASVSAYKSASGWNARASYIQAIPS